MKKIFLITILAILAMAAVIHAQPQLLTYPLTLESMSDTVTVTWSDPGVTCEMIYGTSPRVYTASPIQQSGQGALSFVPGSIAGTTGGVYYCRISETAGSMSTTQEFQLYVENTNAPHLIQPGAATLTGTAINTLSPNFQWNSVNGVPFDTVMLSDEPVQIQVPSSGSGNNITITSDPIWLVTTNQTNITYPTPDPSGYYNQMQPPPLMQGLTYSWCAFNNY